MAKEARLDLEYHYKRAGKILINKDIPIECFQKANRKYVIYYESQPSPTLNKYIEEHFEEISQRIHSKGFTFIYPPKLISEIQQSIEYIYPGTTPLQLANYTTEDFYNDIQRNIINSTKQNPLLIIPDHKNFCKFPIEILGDSNTPCFVYELEYIKDEQVEYILNKDINNLTSLFDDGVRYCLVKGDVPAKDPIDNADQASIERISEEIQIRINQLYAMGVTTSVISKLITLPTPKLSHLLITKDYQIILTDYNNMKIEMPNLSKVLFFFYLNHPEGVRFKELRGYEKELTTIYSTISNLENTKKMKKSIDDIIDSTKNSVNEKCSRIRAAFISKFQDELARQYYITGEAGEVKKIILDRTLVTDKSGLIQNK